VIMRVKGEIRIIGWDDAPFTFRDRETLLMGVVCRGGGWVDGILTAQIDVDGHNATSRIAESVRGSGHHDQLRVIMLNGITFGGFNIVDLEALHRMTGLPVIAVIRSRPDLDSIKKALGKFQDSRKRWNRIKKAGRIQEIMITGKVIKEKNKRVYYQKIGVSRKTAEEIIRVSCTRSLVPEPLRVAHLICSGLKGRKYKAMA
jgi:endonuclease V-like protein UPF0215 family